MSVHCVPSEEVQSARWSRTAEGKGGILRAHPQCLPGSWPPGFIHGVEWGEPLQPPPPAPCMQVKPTAGFAHVSFFKKNKAGHVGGASRSRRNCSDTMTSLQWLLGPGCWLDVTLMQWHR